MDVFCFETRGPLVAGSQPCSSCHAAFRLNLKQTQTNFSDCSSCNEEIYFHVLRGWLHWDLAQRKTVSDKKKKTLHSWPTRADDISSAYKCEVVC